MLSRTKILRSLSKCLVEGVNKSGRSVGVVGAVGGARHSSHFTYVPDTVSTSEGETVRMNLFQAVNNAMDIALASDPSASNNIIMI